MAIAIDVLLALLALLFITAGIRKGFIRSLIGFAGAIVALILAIFLGELLANLIYTAFIRGPMVEKISEAISIQGAGTVEQQAQAALSTLPGFVGNALASLGVTAQQVAAQISGSADTAAGAAADFVSPVFVKLIGLILAVLLFFVVLFLVRLIGRLVDRVFRLPLLKQVNGLLGGVFGLLKSIVVIFCLATVLAIVLPMMGAKSAGVVRQTVEKSYICRWFYEHNPVAAWFSLDLHGG